MFIKRSIATFGIIAMLGGCQQQQQSEPAATGQTPAAERDYISIVGSSTVYPFTTVVAEQFGRSTSFKTPKIESTGSGGGLKLFAAGVGADTPDITNASRAIKKSECQMAEDNGITNIVEIKVGYDGIVMASSRKAEPFELSLKDVFHALAKMVPDPAGSGKLVENPNKTWNDVNNALPETKIEVLGPPPTSGTRDAFVELAMEAGAKSYSILAELRGLGSDNDARIREIMTELGIGENVYADLEKSKGKKPSGKDIFKLIAHGIREDGAFIEAGENDNLIVQKLDANPAAVGIFGYSFLDQNSDKLQGLQLNGIAPTFENIASSEYPISRALFIYVKAQHADVIPGMREFLDEYTSEKAWGPNGYLSEKGLIPMPEDERKFYREAALTLDNKPSCK